MDTSHDKIFAALAAAGLDPDAVDAETWAGLFEKLRDWTERAEGLREAGSKTIVDVLRERGAVLLASQPSEPSDAAPGTFVHPCASTIH